MASREDRFGVLFASAYGPLWAYARRRVAPGDVDDIVADTLTTAWRRLDEVPSGEAQLPWLFGVAYRVIGNHRRAARRRLNLVARLAREPGPRAGVDPPPGVLEALGRLHPRDRELLRLAAWEGLTAAEIAVVLDCSANAAALRLSRARARLRAHLTGTGPTRTHAHRKEIDA